MVLEGSERLNDTKASGVRLQETVAINKSLTALGDVITSLAKPGQHIPYRNSILTKILTNYLGGDSKTLMFVNISPLINNFHQTLCSLRFADKVQNCFEGCYVSGGAVSASSGVPDIGIVSIPDFCKVIKEVNTCSALPVLADADTGFGEAEQCAKTVYDYYQAGAAGMHIEDQVFPKKCGHLEGKKMIPLEDMIKKLEFSLKASLTCSDGDFIICARTDARANMTEFGKTKYIKLEEFEKAGYNCAIYPVSTLRVAMKSIENFLVELKSSGTQVKFLDKMQTRTDLYEILNYSPLQEWNYPSPTRKKK